MFGAIASTLSWVVHFKEFNLDPQMNGCLGGVVNCSDFIYITK